MSAQPGSSPTRPASGRSRLWKLRTRTLTLPMRPLLMGILNVTPDSFSDGGKHFEPQTAIDEGLHMVDQGADILDIGGESTRPYSEPVSAKEELRRVLPVISVLCEQVSVPVSIDTSKAAVAREALAVGAQLINDVTALTGDPEMLTLAAESGCGVCAMHMQGTPRTMQDDPTYDDVVEDVLRYLYQRRDSLIAAGVQPERISLDPGIGFGKTLEHNLALLASCHRFHELGCPILVGHSRKGFIAKVLGGHRPEVGPEADRTAGDIGVALSLASQGVQILRVHQIEPVRHALLLFEATGGAPTAGWSGQNDDRH